MNGEPPVAGGPLATYADGEGATPLMYACQQAKEADLKEIMRKKPAAVRERDRTQKSALHYCAESAGGAVSCAEAVLAEAPELLDARDEDGYNPLHLAVIAGNCALVRLLIARGADINCLDNERHSVVHWATVCGEVEALETVLSASAASSTPDLHGGYPLHYAAQMCGPAGELAGGPRLGLAVLRTLLASGVDVAVADHDGRQPILWAASAGSADAILALVNAGANVEADDKDGLTALHCAASRGHTDCLETLASLCGAAVDVMDSNGCTALFYAVTLGHADATRLLLDHGAQPNRQDRKGRTPAHCGAAKGQLETLRILATRGANVWARNVKGDYPLHEAVSSGRKDLVRWLLSQRPDAVNASNNDGRCPLHVAAVNNNVEMCKILLDGDSLVNPVMRTSRGAGLMTPLDAALHKANRGCAKYLQLHGGVPANRLTSQSAALRGSAHRADPHSDQVNTPEWNHLMVPELRGAQSLVHSPIERLTVVDSTRTVQVRVEDELLHRRASESSIDDKVRRRRRKRRSKRDGSEVETDSSDIHRRRRRRVRTDHNDTSDEEYEVESRRRRRKGRKGKISDESVSEDGSKKKKKESQNGRKRSVGDCSSDYNKNGKENIDLNSNNKESNNKGDSTENKNNDTTKENVIVVKEEMIKTKEYTKSKKVTEHREEEQSSTKPTVTKKSKTTCEETKTEEQITTKTSETITTPTPNESKENEASTQDENITVQQLVTAIVHQEESGEKVNLEENINGSVNIEQRVENENSKAEDPSIEADNKNQTTQHEDDAQEHLDETNLETEHHRDQVEQNAKGFSDVKIKNHKKPRDDEVSFWDDEESDQVPTNNTYEDKDKVNIVFVQNTDEPDEEADPKLDIHEIIKDTSELREKDTPIEEPTESQDANVELLDTESKTCQDTSVENTYEIPNVVEIPAISEHDGKTTKDDQETQNIYNVDDIISTCIGDEAKLENVKDELVITRKESDKEDQSLNKDESIKGLVKVLGRSEIDYDHLKGVVKVDKISSDDLKEKSKSREESRGRSRRGSSFEIVSPARSMLDDEGDSETPRSRSRIGTDSQLHDSGFEPSPRRDTSKEASRIPRACRNRRRSLSSHSLLRNDSYDDRPELSTVSVTQAVQHSMRKYHLERRIFHELLELKRLQIRAGRSNEAVLVKRLVDDYRRAGLWIGLSPYEGHFTFRAFEKYLYDQLRLLQNSDRRIIPRLKSTDDLEKLTRALRCTRAGAALLEDAPANPMHCTHRTHRCFHATHAYTGVPCAAYIGKIDHHTMAKPDGGGCGGQPSFLPRIESGKRRPDGQGAEIARCLRYVDPSRPVTLELSHGGDRQLISLPTERLDKNKRYYVTFTIKGGDLQQPEKAAEQDKRHRHAKSF